MLGVVFKHAVKITKSFVIVKGLRMPQQLTRGLKAGNDKFTLLKNENYLEREHTRGMGKRSENETAKFRRQRYFHVMKETAKINKLTRPGRKYKFWKWSRILGTSELNQNYA